MSSTKIDSFEVSEAEDIFQICITNTNAYFSLSDRLQRATLLRLMCAVRYEGSETIGGY